MEEFRAALGQYLVGNMEVADLEAAVDEALASSVDAGPQLTMMLDDLYRTGRLSHQIYAVLKRRIQSWNRDLGQIGPGADGNESDQTRFQWPR